MMPRALKLALQRLSDEEAQWVLEWLDSSPDAITEMLEAIDETHLSLALSSPQEKPAPKKGRKR